MFISDLLTNSYENLNCSKIQKNGTRFNSKSDFSRIIYDISQIKYISIGIRLVRAMSILTKNYAIIHILSNIPALLKVMKVDEGEKFSST